eukprot:TRINITY_DN4550_c2_g1_i1.p1 TRINITY_DN4550_c2_g1~~TRINITY_DN4550_c2_g1_i1.p1  ORF type:complete len:715 (-),score=172.56 TRINITY_DN4550_c2_g1_i1:46-2190(-)
MQAQPMDVDRTPTKEIDVQKLQQKLGEDIQQYFIQLTKGCGVFGCTNPYSASSASAPKRDTQTAAIEAFSLASKGTQNLCTHRPKPESFNLATMRSLVDEAKEKGTYTPIIRQIGSLFSQSEHVNNMFLNEWDPKNEITFGVDLKSVKDFYALVESLQQNGVSNALANASEQLAANMKRSAPTCTSLESLRQFVILWENPLLNDHNHHRAILGPLLLSITLLPKSSQDLLMRWWETYSKDDMQHYLGMLQQYITLRIILPPFVPMLNSDDYIIAVVKVMNLLYTANEKSKVLSYNDFYNDLINEKIDLKEDFVNWKEDTGFSFCKYPFILHPSVKSKILQIESLVQMRQQREAAIRQLFMGIGSVPALVMKIRREYLIEDSLSEISRHPPEDLKKELRVHFVGEEAIDEGGVQKEWFQLIVREIFDPKYGMFIDDPDTRTYWFNHLSSDFLEYQLIGNLLGLAIYNGVILDIHFPQIVYKKLLGLKPNLEDLKQTHPALATGLQKLLDYEGDVEDVFGHTFEVRYEYFGEQRTHELKPGGSNISLNNQNRQEYVDLYVNYLLEESVKKQFDAFQKGFSLVCDSPGFHLFRSEELELLICGSPVLDFEALEKNALYDNGFTKDHKTIRMFWEVVHSLSVEQKKKLLFFATGSDRAPIGGLGKMQFIITRHGEDSDRLPSAHTCFNILLLPEYSTIEKLKDRVLTAISNAEGFGMK